MQLHRILFGLAFGSLLLLCGPEAAWAQDGDGAGAGDTETEPVESALVTRPIVSPVAIQRVAPVESLLLAGQYDKALAEAQALYEGADEEGLKTEAQRLMADALRKKGEWKDARVTYLKVGNRYAKASDDYLKYMMIVDILKMSPTGTYRAVVQSAGGEDAALPTLADEAHLADAIRHQTELMAKKATARAAVLMKRAKAPRAVLTVFLEVLEEFRQARAVCSGLACEDDHNAAHLAGARLQDVANQTLAQMQAKAIKVRQKRNTPWSYTNVEKQEIPKCNALLKDCADVEEQFQAAVGKVGGADQWTEGEEIGRLSSERAARYNQLAEEFFIRPYSVDVLW
ncbi:MAG: hypothetical protein WBD63_01650 [Phycisphaerae bacterium]|nr:hypothetical protein [Phycisphaerae bacterium]